MHTLGVSHSIEEAQRLRVAVAFASQLRYAKFVYGPSRGFLWTVCVTYTGLALLYNALTPIGESPDEIAHFEYLHLVVNERRLPRADDRLWEGHQAPLYYLAQAVWARLIHDLSGCPTDPARLPNHLNPGFPKPPNLNWLVHADTEHIGAWGCPEWSFHLVRLLSTLFTIPLVLLTFGTLRETMPAFPAAVAVGGMITALLPSHVAISAMVNNDALVNLLIVAITYLVLIAYRTGEPADLGRGAMLASLAATAKLSSLYLFGLMVVALATQRDLSRRLFRSVSGRVWLAVTTLCLLLPCLVLARNLREWGDPFAASALETNLVKLRGAGINPPGEGILHYYLVELRSLFADGFFIAYGAINFRYGEYLEIGGWAMRVITAGLLLSVFVRGAWRRVKRGPFLILAAGFLLFFVTYFYPGYRYRWLQVRYFFNQLPFLSLIAAIGILTLWESIKKMLPLWSDRILFSIVYAFLLGLNLLVLGSGVLPHLYQYIGIIG